MKLLLVLAVVCFILAIIALAIPASVLFTGVLASGLGWTAGGLLLLTVDFLLGGWVVPVGGRRLP